MDSLPLIALAIILVVALVAFAGMSRMNRQKTGLDRKYYEARWREIQAYQTAGGPSWQLAIMEADKLLDHALKAYGIHGETMGERLKAARGNFTNNDAIWFAHKLRNRLAHEDTANLNRIVVDKALRAFKAGLKNLGAL